MAFAVGSKPSAIKHSDKCLQAEIKNRVEVLRYRLMTKLLDKEKFTTQVHIDREKRTISRQLQRTKRQTSGHCVAAQPPDGPHDDTYHSSRYFMGGSAVSEKRLGRWKVTEKQVEKDIRIFADELKLLPWERKKQNEAELFGYSFQIVMGFLGYDPEQIERTIKRAAIESKNKAHSTYIPARTTKQDVFECLKQTADDVTEPLTSSVSSRSPSMASVDKTFSVKNWEKELIKDYTSLLSQSSTTKRIKSAPIVHSKQSYVDHHYPRAQTAKDRSSTTKRLSSTSSTARIRRLRPHSALSASPRRLSVQSDGRPKSAETSTACSDDLLLGSSDEEDDELYVDGKGMAHIHNQGDEDEVFINSDDEKRSHNVPYRSITNEHANNYAKNTTDKYAHEHIKRGSENVSVGTNLQFNRGSSLELGAIRELMNDQEEIFERGDDNTAISYDDERQLLKQCSPVDTSVNNETALPGKEKTLRSDTNSDSSLGISLRLDTNAHHWITTEDNVTVAAGQRPQSPLDSKQRLHRVSFTEFAPGDRTTRAYKDSLLADGLMSPLDLEPRPPDSRRPSQYSASSSTRFMYDTDVEYNRLPQWKRDLLKEAPPSLSGAKGAAKVNLIMSTAQRRRELQRLVHEQASDVRQICDQEQSRRLQSRQNVLGTMKKVQQAIDNLVPAGSWDIPDDKLSRKTSLGNDRRRKSQVIKEP